MNLRDQMSIAEPASMMKASVRPFGGPYEQACLTSRVHGELSRDFGDFPPSTTAFKHARFAKQPHHKQRGELRAERPVIGLRHDGSQKRGTRIELLFSQQGQRLPDVAVVVDVRAHPQLQTCKRAHNDSAARPQIHRSSQFKTAVNFCCVIEG